MTIGGRRVLVRKHEKGFPENCMSDAQARWPWLREDLKGRREGSWASLLGQAPGAAAVTDEGLLPACDAYLVATTLCTG